MARLDVTRLRAMAEECRALALAAKTPEIKADLIKIAEGFERMALRREPGRGD